MRWLIREDFEAIPVGAYQARALILTAVLFAMEHGPYWDVGLAAGPALQLVGRSQPQPGRSRSGSRRDQCRPGGVRHSGPALAILDVTG